MVSSKIENLSTGDLECLENILSAEMRRRRDYAASFRSKNHYSPADDTQQLQRLLAAVRSQKRLTTLTDW